MGRNPRPRNLAAAALGAALLLAPSPGRAGDDAPKTEPGVVADVRVERVAPKREKLPTLRFLKENRDFIRQRYDRLREKPVVRRGEAEAIDPRFLAYRDMLGRIAGAGDSLAAAEEARRRLELFRSITQLGDLESQLDLMDRLLAEQRGRLGVLQANFTGDQRTALSVVVSGYPAAASPTGFAVTLEDGSALAVALDDAQRESLRHGGVVQIFHGLVEPREQVIQLTLTGDRWPSGESGYVTLEPSRDRLSFLRLDLSAVQPELGAPSIHATTWQHDAGTP